MWLNSKAAGLPNINGQFETRNTSDAYSVIFNCTKSFSYSKNGASTSVNGGMKMDTYSYKPEIVYFNASKSNSIYGSSSTNQPKSCLVRYYIRY